MDKRKLIELLLNLDMELYEAMHILGLREKVVEVLMDIVRNHEKAIVALAGAEKELAEFLFGKAEDLEELRRVCSETLRYILEKGNSPSFDALMDYGGSEA